MEGQLFVIRVYGILVNDNRVLVSDEIHHNRFITKFPGGGLEFGESTLDCLRREFLEELDLEIEIKNHFYTVDFFQVSAFNPKQQVISIYYLVSVSLPELIKTDAKKRTYEELAPVQQSFRWLKLSALSEADFTFPIDKHVAQMLSLKF